MPIEGEQRWDTFEIAVTADEYGVLRLTIVGISATAPNRPLHIVEDLSTAAPITLALNPNLTSAVEE